MLKPSPPPHVSQTRLRLWSWRFIAPAILAFCLLTVSGKYAPAQQAVYLGDPGAGVDFSYNQQWGDFGRNTAAAKPGTKGAALRVGEKTYAKGLGHHANGEIVVDLGRQYSSFAALVGVQWQGGNKGRMVFQVSVDGKIAFDSGPMSDADPPKEINVSVEGARQLRLIADDGGNGIGCDMANWIEARLVRNPGVPYFGEITASFNGDPAPAPSAPVCGLSMIANESGPQVAIIEPAKAFTVSVDRNEEVRFVIPISNMADPLAVMADVAVVGENPAEVEFTWGEERVVKRIENGQSIELKTPTANVGMEAAIFVTTRGVEGETGVRWSRFRYSRKGQTSGVPLLFAQSAQQFPPPVLPNPRPSIERELIEWDWRMQDGIGTDREPRTYSEAVQIVLERGDRLVQDLTVSGVALGDLVGQWGQARSEWKTLSANDAASESQWEELWRRVHALRRTIAFENPLADTGPLLFAKHVPGAFSHQLTQYLGKCSRPGGGIFVLDAPGVSLACRQLGSLPTGNYQHPEVSWDGSRVLFSFCQSDSAAADWRTAKQFYHLFDMAADGSDVRQLTEGPYNDFAPRYLPNGKILFVSTRRGGFHRCGRGPCPVYTMAVANADGSDPRVISFHETHEWDPAVLNDGRVIYTRWDYVDRHAVHYQQLWTVRPDGSDVRIFYGNNTLNPVGVWEARPVPGSNLVMATAGAHHAMTAGSIILLDVTRGIDDLDPITRLTPDARFPESEARVERWHATAGVTTPPPEPVEEKRWPGHCYRTPLPLSKDYFLVSYSYDPLIGEPFANHPNMFGIYLVDRFGNKELVYRDVGICSLWPTPLRARRRLPDLPSALAKTDTNEGTFFVQNVHQSWPKLGEKGQVTIKSLRLIQVLPKTTPNANMPRVGLANASPGKQVLGTVPVEADGSAYFRAPAGIPMAFQALDERGMAVQTMRSLTYLQPGENATCIGCHESRSTVPSHHFSAIAKQRPPSTIKPGPDGSKPLCYPILVQPVLDRLCVECHNGPESDGGLDLSGKPAGAFTASYNALAPLVSYSEWKGTPQANSEPMTAPDTFGARASKLMALLLEGHENVELTPDDLERLSTWMDANALFYGTFDPEDQKRQQLGELIAGPALE
jgi:NPCBM/NEW2 domain-containing protein/hydrazine synthase alpha subunit-like protein/WD40 repeat protein